MQVKTRSAQETQALGGQLALTRPADAGALTVVWLTGELGAGKTTLARGFLDALGVTGAVRSPTYTLLELYELPSFTVLHVDLYRLRDPSELDTLGLRDWARPGCLWLIEWPDRAASRLPPPDLILTFTVGVPAHDIEARAASPLGEKWLERAAAAGPR